jgi:hypothetical protein
VSLGRIAKRECRVNYRLHRAGFEERPHVTMDRRGDGALVGDWPGSQRRASDGEPALNDRLDVQRFAP